MSDGTEGMTSERAPKASAASSIMKKAVSGAFWITVTGWLARAAGLVGTLAITHYIDPSSYGEASVAAIVAMTSGTLSSLGIGQYIVAKPDIDKRSVFHATFYFTVLGIVAVVLTQIFAKPIARLVNSQTIAAYLPGLLVVQVIERVNLIQDRVLLRKLQFRAAGLSRSVGELVYTISSVGLAAFFAPPSILGGAYALVWGSLARAVVRFFVLVYVTPWREWAEPCRITREGTHDLFSFSVPMWIAQTADFGSRKWDNLVLARHFGVTAQGFYNLAYNLADIPASQVGDTIGDVLVPSFAKLQNDDERRRALLFATKMLMLVVAPLAVGLGVVSNTVVRTFFPPKWGYIAYYLAILSVLSIVRPVGWMGIAYLQVRKQTRVVMVLEVIKTFALLVLMYGFAKATENPRWTAAAVGITFGASSFSYMVVIKRLDDISLGRQFAHILPPVLACVPMAIAVLAVQKLEHYLFPFVPGLRAGNILRLCIEVTAGGLAYVIAAFVILPSTAREFIRTVRSAMARRRGGAPAEEAASS